MFKSLQWRLVGIFILLNIILILPTGLLLNRSVETQYYNNFRNNIEEGLKNWKVDSTFTSAEMLDYLQTQRNIIYEFKVIGTNMNYVVLRITPETGYDIVYSSIFLANDEESRSFKLELAGSDNFINALAGSKGNRSKLEHIDSESFFDYAVPLKLLDGDCILYFRYGSEEWREITTNFSNILIRSLLAAFLISLIIGYPLSRTITRPIKEITRNAKQIASGDFEQALEVKSGDEIGQLTATFNSMASSLKDTLGEVSREKTKIETILNYMTDGVIAFNLKGEVIHANPVSKALLNVKDIEFTFNEFAGKFGLEITLEEILYLETFNTKDASIQVGDKYMQVFFAIFADEHRNREGILLVLHDVTEERKLELMRRDFVANVSHELRTPITSVKSYAESLLDGALDNREMSEKFLGVINSEADRMTRLVKDLLELSRLDNQQMQWNFDRFSFADMVKLCVDKMRIEAAAMKQKLECYVIGDLPEIMGDKDRLEQVIVNLLSNALKYTPEGGSITVYVGKSSMEVYAKVVDTGDGIPAEDLPRIFERFYRVDKARAREQGGTGLGLSIAKEIVEAHHGSITITSKMNKGTEVVVKLPINQP